MDINEQLKKLNSQLNQLVNDIKNWPQYRKIGAIIILLGLILLIIGVLIY